MINKFPFSLKGLGGIRDKLSKVEPISWIAFAYVASIGLGIASVTMTAMNSNIPSFDTIYNDVKDRINNLTDIYKEDLREKARNLERLEEIKKEFDEKIPTNLKKMDSKRNTEFGILVDKLDTYNALAGEIKEMLKNNAEILEEKLDVGFTVINHATKQSTVMHYTSNSNGEEVEVKEETEDDDFAVQVEETMQSDSGEYNLVQFDTFTNDTVTNAENLLTEFDWVSSPSEIEGSNNDLNIDVDTLEPTYDTFVNYVEYGESTPIELAVDSSLVEFETYIDLNETGQITSINHSNSIDYSETWESSVIDINSYVKLETVPGGQANCLTTEEDYLYTDRGQAELGAQIEHLVKQKEKKERKHAKLGKQCRTLGSGQQVCATGFGG